MSKELDKGVHLTKVAKILEDFVTEWGIGLFKEDKEAMVKLMLATSATISSLVKQAQDETAKAFGGCTKCYGKGYATVRAGETYRGATHNIRNQVKFCTCGRGEQLEAEIKRLKEDK